MRKNFIKIVIILLLIICISLIGVLFYVKASNNIRKGGTNDLRNKVVDEISYIDSNIIEGMNKLNNITTTRYKIYTKTVNEKDNNKSDSQSSNQSNENSNSIKISEISNESVLNESNENNNKNEEDNKDEINWNDISNIYENIYSIWASVQLDLKKLKIGEEYLENFNIDLDGIAQSIVSKDKVSCIINFYNLYSQLQNYITVATDNYDLINLYSTKNAILNAYTLSFSEDKWNEMSSSIKAARNSYFVNIVNNNTNNKNINKIDIMLKNLESTVDLNNKNVFYIHYKNIIQELQNLEV